MKTEKKGGDGNGAEQPESALEAILFALGEPVEGARLAQALGCPLPQVEEACQALARDYEARGGLRLVRLERSWQLVSAPRWGEVVRGCWQGKSRTSSPRRPWRPWPWWPISSR